MLKIFDSLTKEKHEFKSVSAKPAAKDDDDDVVFFLSKRKKTKKRVFLFRRLKLTHSTGQKCLLQ